MTVRETIVEETLSSAAAIVTVFQTTKLKKRGKEKTFIGPGRIGFEENMKRKSGGTRKNKNGGGRVHSFERYKRRVSTILSFSLVVSSQILSTLQQSSSAATSLHYSFLFFFQLFIRLGPLCTCRGERTRHAQTGRLGIWLKETLEGDENRKLKGEINNKNKEGGENIYTTIGSFPLRRRHFLCSPALPFHSVSAFRRRPHLGFLTFFSFFFFFFFIVIWLFSQHLGTWRSFCTVFLCLCLWVLEVADNFCFICRIT